MPLSPTTYAEARSLAERMAANPADAVSLAGRLAELISALPPEKSEILSRYAFDRASLWTMIASFEFVDGATAGGPSPFAPDVNVICEHDTWVRGVVAQSIPIFRTNGTQVNLAALARMIEMRQAACFPYGLNGLPFFEANFVLDDRQGFVSNGNSEIFAPAPLIFGDGVMVAPLDWRLQKDQTITVKVRNRTDLVFPPETGEVLTPLSQTLRWVVVSFWAEELLQPSAR